MQSKLFTCIAIHRRRGFEAIEELFGNSFENACLVTDRWPAYFKTNANNHQLCLAHLQRKLLERLNRLLKDMFLSTIKKESMDYFEKMTPNAKWQQDEHLNKWA